jgi:SET domain-containing protein
LFFTFARVTAVDGQYQIGIYSVRKIQHGEEITFDYNSVTEVCPVACWFLFIQIITSICGIYYLCLMKTYSVFISLQSKEEYEASVCLCGSQVCRGSYLNLTGEGAFQKV